MKLSQAKLNKNRDIDNPLKGGMSFLKYINKKNKNKRNGKKKEERRVFLDIFDVNNPIPQKSTRKINGTS